MAKKRKHRHSRKHYAKLIYSCAILLLVVVILYSGLQILESTVLYAGTEDESFETKTITRGDTRYFPRQDITVVMILGIDQMGKVEKSEGYMNHGAADMAALLVFDETNETYTVLQLNRDTMVEMPVIGLGGKRAGTYYGQLALSHTYGTGLEDSCENTRETISKLLGGIHIDYYVAMNMDAIAMINDAVGGVTVTVTDDFSKVDPTIGMGEVTLMGDQAMHFVRTRKDVGDQLNLTRIQRQKTYIGSFIEALQRKYKENSAFVLNVYDDVHPYLVTDCSGNIISGMLDRYERYDLQEVVTPKGENVLGEEYFEFYVDEEALDKLILRLFYIAK